MQQQITYEYNRTALPSNATSMNVLLLTWKWNVIQVKASIHYQLAREDLISRYIKRAVTISSESMLILSSVTA
jgi:hypothetical protein